MPGALLETRDLEKQFDGTIALDRVSLEVHEGEIFGLLGPNGAGKTTLLSILSCLIKASSGSALFLGKELYPGNREIRRQIGIVPQELALYGELTPRENLAFFGELYGLGGAALRQRVDKVLTAVGLEDRADQRVETFSGGMKRRLNLGAGLIHEPRLLLLDEPTTGVDPQSRNHIFEEIRRVHRAGVTVIYTSHYMEEVQALCSRIGIMDHGRVIACDTLPDLLRQLHGLVRFRVSAPTPELHERIAKLSNTQVMGSDDGWLHLECHDVKGTLLRVVSILNELQMELVALETEEPNLEMIFLHLTGRGLRD